MSEGLARTGIAEAIGQRIAHVAGTSEVRMITLFMLVGGGLSAFMNNIGVAALLVPVAVEVARSVIKRQSMTDCRVRRRASSTVLPAH